MKIREKDFLRAVRRADPRYFSEVRERMADAALQKGKRLMKQQEKKHIVRKIAIGALIAAATLGGGYAAMVALRNNQGIFGEESRDISSMVEERDTLHLNLTDQQWNPAEYEAVVHGDNSTWFIPTEDGVYHPFAQECYASDGEREDDFIDAQNAYLETHKLRSINIPCAVSFTPSDTKESVPLCDRPNCLHNGSEYCEATTERFIHTELVSQDGVIYAAATGAQYGEKSNWKTGAYLLSYAPDGTGLDVLCDFGIDYAAICCAPVVHRGYVWCIFEKTIPNVPIDPAKGLTGSSGYVIVGYEIATGKTVEVYSCMPEAGSNRDYQMPAALTASGDRLIYLQDGGAWPSVNVKGIFSVNLVTGKHEQLVTEKYCSQFTVAGDKIYYQRFSDTNSSSKLCVYDINTRETETLIEKYTGMHIKADGEMLCMTQADYSKEDPHYSVVFTDMQGNPLGEARVPDKRVVRRIAIYGDDVYVSTHGLLSEFPGTRAGIYETWGYEGTDNRVMRCSKSALLAGNAVFETVAVTTEMIEIDMDAWRAAHPEE